MTRACSCKPAGSRRALRCVPERRVYVYNAGTVNENGKPVKK